jgi:hypothetical protein
VAVDAFFRTLPQRGGNLLWLAGGGSAGMGAALGDLAQAPGLAGGTRAGEADGPVAGDLEAWSTVLFALLGTPRAARDEEPESRKPKHPQRG